ncbi:40S ribosomal S27 protein [Rutstroemia sp. NJR-2017a WRK4]|nr:40S ribosomal S27 protein [Rutstroemia sp. NJR-2017a WRK4]
MTALGGNGELAHDIETILSSSECISGGGIWRLRVLAVDLLNPSPAAEARKHKLKQLVPGPRSFFMDVKCPGCFTITTVFSHAQTVVICAGCSTVLCQPTGGKARLTEGCSFRRK